MESAKSGYSCLRQFPHLFSRTNGLLLLLFALFQSATTNAITLDQLIQDSLSETIVTSALLTNDDYFTFGLVNFNPNDYLEVDDDQLGSNDALEQRKRTRIYNLPLEKVIHLTDFDSELRLQFQAANVEGRVETEIVGSPGSSKDVIQDNVYILGAGVSWRRFLVGNRLQGTWFVEPGLKGYWMRYANRTDYNSSESRRIAPLLDGLFTNTDVKVWLAEPTFAVGYETDSSRGIWRFTSSYHYLGGQTFATTLPIQETRPEAWFWSNGVGVQVPFLRRINDDHKLLFRLKRIDLGGDLGDSLGNDHYYEAGIGWIVNTGDNIPLVENMGVLLNFNYGSDMRGGTIGLLYNVD